MVTRLEKAAAVAGLVAAVLALLVVIRRGRLW
jgi:hypothetical protein